jgi:hypothetical protein
MKILRFCAAALVLGLTFSCATKKKEPSAHAATAAGKPKASPSPTATPAPSPTPEARYIASVSVEGGESTSRVISSESSPSPSPSASPTPAASPSPTPKSKSPNFLSATWRKIFPAKVKATPTPTPQMVFRVTTENGNQAEIPVGGSGPQMPPSEPAPTPIMLKSRPTENFASRLWHKVFPKKAAPPSAEPPQWVGVVKLVNERDGYALVDTQNYAALPAGETLNAVGEDRETGVLRITADRQAPFFIADIVSGKPRAGDRVYSPKP